jgi:hypothetical protein
MVARKSDILNHVVPIAESLGLRIIPNNVEKK